MARTVPGRNAWDKEARPPSAESRSFDVGVLSQVCLRPSTIDAVAVAGDEPNEGGKVHDDSQVSTKRLRCVANFDNGGWGRRMFAWDRSSAPRRPLGHCLTRQPKADTDGHIRPTDRKDHHEDSRHPDGNRRRQDAPA